MKSAVIGRVDGDLSRINPLRKVRNTEHDLRDQIEITGVKRTPDGLDINEGRAAREELTEQDSVKLNGDGITVVSEEKTRTKYTEFLAVPDAFVGIDTKQGSFLFDLLEQETGVQISRVEVDIDDFAAAFPNATPWKVGFYGHGEQAENGVVHGENVLDDDELGGVLKGTKKNQLGLRMNYDGREFKMTITKSGYVSVYEPKNLDSAEFAEFVVDKILPYTD